MSMITTMIGSSRSITFHKTGLSYSPISEVHSTDKKKKEKNKNRHRNSKSKR